MTLCFDGRAIVILMYQYLYTRPCIRCVYSIRLKFGCYSSVTELTTPPVCPKDALEFYISLLVAMPLDRQ